MMQVVEATTMIVTNVLEVVVVLAILYAGAEGSECRVVLTAQGNSFVDMRARKEYAEARAADR
jgi:hypothetical protein